MSVHITSRAWKTDGLSMTQKIVLVKLADNANDQGVGWPAIPNIAIDCSCSERSVFNAIRELEVMGHIKRSRRSGNSTLYHVHPCTTFTPETDAPLQEMHPTPAPDAPPPLHHVHVTPAPRSPKPSRTVSRTINEPSKGDLEENQIKMPYPSQEFAESWAAWVRHKKEIKQKLPTSTMEIQLKRLGKWGEAKAIEAIENSIAAKWQGLFEPKIDQGKYQAKPTPQTHAEARKEAAAEIDIGARIPGRVIKMSEVIAQKEKEAAEAASQQQP